MAEIVTLDPFVRGDTWTNKFTFVDDAGAPIDITGWQLWVTLKLDPTAEDANADLQDTLVVPSSADSMAGIGYVVSAPAKTGLLIPAVYFVDFQYKQPSGEVMTVAIGTVTVQRDITRAS